MSRNLLTGGFRLHKLSGSELFGVIPPAFLAKVTSTHATTPTTKCMIAVLNSSDLDNSGFIANFFATGWKVRGVDCTTAANNAVPFDITASSITGELTTAACNTGWIKDDLVMVCTDEYSAMIDAATLPAGSEFTITKTLAKTGIGETAAALTGATSGDLTLVRVAIQNDLTNAVSGGGTNGVNIISTDTIPLNAEILATGVNMGAGGFISKEIGFKVATTKAVQVKNTAAGGALTGTGNLTFHLTFRRNSVGATVAAA